MSGVGCAPVFMWILVVRSVLTYLLFIFLNLYSWRRLGSNSVHFEYEAEDGNGAKFQNVVFFNCTSDTGQYPI
jgi:hypothetical protein